MSKNITRIDDHYKGWITDISGMHKATQVRIKIPIMSRSNSMSQNPKELNFSKGIELEEN